MPIINNPTKGARPPNEPILGMFRKTPLYEIQDHVLNKSEITLNLDGNETPPYPKQPFNIKTADSKVSARKNIHAMTTHRNVRIPAINLYKNAEIPREGSNPFVIDRQA